LDRAFEVARHVVVNPLQCAQELRQLSSAVSYAAVVHKSSTTARAPLDLDVIDVHTLLNYLVRVHREQEGNLISGLRGRFHSVGMAGDNGGGLAGFVNEAQFLLLAESLAPPDAAWPESELRKLFSAYAAEAAAKANASAARSASAAAGLSALSSLNMPLIDFVVFVEVSEEEGGGWRGALGQRNLPL
jgi:hypothetical protein